MNLVESVRDRTALRDRIMDRPAQELRFVANLRVEMGDLFAPAPERRDKEGRAGREQEILLGRLGELALDLRII